MINGLRKREFNGGGVSETAERGFRLRIPAISGGQYALAQLDDYMSLRRRKFPHQAPVRLSLEAQVSGENIRGTWGFGFWNDPFSYGFGGGGTIKSLPVLPNAAWFFFGSKENHLSLRDDLPGSGFHVKTFRSPLLPSFLSLFALPALPTMLFPASARFLRKAAARIVREDALAIPIPVGDWHLYQLDWAESEVRFCVDDQVILTTPTSPRGPLGLVIWIDNQFFQFDPKGKMGFGSLQTDHEQGLMIRNLNLNH